MLLWPLHVHSDVKVTRPFAFADFGERDAENIKEKGGDNLYFRQGLTVRFHIICPRAQGCNKLSYRTLPALKLGHPGVLNWRKNLKN